MINFINKNDQLNENKNSLNVSYVRNVNIIYGNYPYPEIIHKFIIDIKNNLRSEMKNHTHVQGGMTDWNYFNDKVEFLNFLTFIINKYQNTHPHIFKHFLQKYKVKDAWGNEIRLGDSLDYHSHGCINGILYLTKGCDLILPELNLKITPEPGDYYIFPPEILHGFDKSEEEKNRYSLVFNIEQNKHLFDYRNKTGNVVK